jgi:hypothetical protein
LTPEDILNNLKPGFAQLSHACFFFSWIGAYEHGNIGFRRKVKLSIFEHHNIWFWFLQLPETLHDLKYLWIALYGYYVFFYLV